jgi:CDP-4-dehydro-6-deoxyglucose reductase
MASADRVLSDVAEPAAGVLAGAGSLLAPSNQTALFVYWWFGTADTAGVPSGPVLCERVNALAVQSSLPFQVHLANGRHFPAAATTSILDSAGDAGLILGHSCRTGRCGLCSATLSAGHTTLLRPELGLTPADAQRGAILTCCRAPASDLQLETEDLGRLAGLERRTLPCRIATLERVAPDVLGVTLRLPPGARFRYVAGQYLNLLHAGVARSYSIANAPRPDDTLDLFIRQVDDGILSRYWFGAARVNDLLRFTGPHGTFFLREDDPGPIVLLATGTGIAPVRALLQDIAALAPRRDVSVYWGNRVASDVFWSPAQALPGARFTPVLSRSDASWTGARGHVQNHLAHDMPDLRDASVYASGSPAMIEDARRTLLGRGLAGRRFHADPFLSSG